MRLVVNGINIEWNNGEDLVELLGTLDKYKEGESSVIINGRIIPNAKQYDTIKLKDGDIINVVTMLIGG